MTEKGIAKILPNDMVLSPLAGYTDAGFRTLAKDFGCGLTVTEMVSAKGLAMNNHVSRDVLYVAEKGVVAAQLFGGEPDAFIAALEKKCFDRFEIIDINMGCPQKKIVGNGEGCALMADVKRAEKIILAVKKSTDKLVTVKFRKGFGNENTAVEFAKMCEGAGADAITVHGRTSDEMFSGRADWGVIKDVVSAVKIPVFANGDIASREDYLNVKEMTGCFGVSVGRGAMGKPYVFAEISGNDFSFDLMSAIKKHFEILLSFMPERLCVNEMKKHICCYLKGIKGSRKAMPLLQSARTAEETLRLVDEFLSFDASC